MAENGKLDRKGMILNDEDIKKTYKAGLDQLKASDELIKAALEKCRTELEIGPETGKKKRSAGIPWSRLALRVGAPLAACLLVLILLLNPPMMGKLQTESAMPQSSADSNTTMQAASESLDEVPEVQKDLGNTNKMVLRFSETMDADDGTDGAFEESRGERSLGAMAKTDLVLCSMDYSQLLTPVSGDLPPEAVKTLVHAYNLERNAQYTCDENKVLTISTLKTGGVGADSLRSASSFDELLDDLTYHMIPLRDENQAYALLLPVIESSVSYDDPSSAPLNLVYSRSGRTWLSSSYAAIPADDSQIAYLLNGEEHRRLVRETFQASQITDYRIVDINNGYDYVIVMKADGEEYAIPHLTLRSLNALENHQAYPVGDVLKALADSLENQ